MVLSIERVDGKFSPCPRIILVAIDLACSCLQWSPSGTTSTLNHRQSYGIHFRMTMAPLRHTWRRGMCTRSDTWTLNCPDTTPNLAWNVCPCSRSTHQWVFSLPRSHPYMWEEVCLCTWGESFQLQMVSSFPFLHANDLRSSLLNIRARRFLLSCT